MLPQADHVCVCVCDYFVFFFLSSRYLKRQDKCKAGMVLIIACEQKAQQKRALEWCLTFASPYEVAARWLTVKNLKMSPLEIRVKED